MRYTICPQCQTENSGSQLVCTGCGASLAGVLRQEKPDEIEYFAGFIFLPLIAMPLFFLRHIWRVNASDQLIER